MKKGTLRIIAIIALLVIGLSLLLYPTVSNLWNRRYSAKTIKTYSDVISELSENEYNAILADAREYNERLTQRERISYTLSEAQKTEYESLLDITGTGVMGYVDIPRIGEVVPIYHGTDEGVLQTAVGHIEWTSLPVGGESTHAVISGHRGLPSAMLFTDLDKLEIGDRFTIRVLSERLVYEVDTINVVEPNEVKTLKIVEGEDLCTLVTCTPYAINSHRLLVRGHRVEGSAPSASIGESEAETVSGYIVFAAILIPMVVILYIIMQVQIIRRRRK